MYLMHWTRSLRRFAEQQHLASRYVLLTSRKISGPICWSPRPWPTWRRSQSCTSVCWCMGGTAGSAHGVVSSHELGSTAIAARACFAKGAISHFHYGAPGCSDIVE